MYIRIKAQCVYHIRFKMNAWVNIYIYISNKQLFYPERLVILNLEPLELRRLKTDILMYYKILNNLIPIPPSIPDYY